jgi:hypothetical protein
MIDELKESKKALSDGTKISPTTIISSELSSFFKTSAETMVEFLTDIFDCPKIFKHTTRGSGTTVIKNAYVNFNAATTPSWIASYFSQDFIDQGFASRTVFIYETKPRFLKAEPVITDEMWAMKDKLLEDLAHIATLEGEVKLSEESREWFANWYHNIWPTERYDYRLESYHGRKPLLLRKVAMLLSLAESDSFTLEVEYFKMAEGLLKSIEPSMVRTFSAVGKNKFASVLERIFNTIVLDEGVEIEQLRRMNLQDLDKKTFDENISNLLAMGAVRAEHVNGKLWLYPILTELT